MSTQRKIGLNVNGRERPAEVASNETLLETLRAGGHFDVKSGCEKGDCGACAVLVDGVAVDSCLTLTWTVEGCEITTVAGLSQGEERHPLVESFLAHGAVQCGYCTPGLVIAADSLLRTTPSPDEEDIRVGLSGNLCRCTGYAKVFDAVRDAAVVMRERRSGR